MSDEHFINGELRSAEQDRQSVMHFAEGMLDKLGKNRHKAHWSNAQQEYLWSRLVEELNELRSALDYQNDKLNIIQECYDVANFAMMIADNLKEENE